MGMFKLNKIRGHVKMLELQQLKLSRYLAEERAKVTPDPTRIADIERAHKRVSDNIKMWQDKLAAFESQPPREPSRPSIIDSTNSRHL